MIGNTKMAAAVVGQITRFATARQELKDRGATAVEYGMIVALIAAIIVASVAFLGLDVLDAFNTVEEEIDGTPGG